ncbi:MULTISPECIES: hypothetical protein [unclassified Sphingomonas]|uniref:hypothetical protein n=1 Tax=unclassified Sphingomonas TaxID=196159 RepID=UPI0007023CEE|nr:MULTISPECIES: hypothetical protein [unclassified Sphingomonas]KQX18415.1 hypothetical protein ASD17_14735 [Sphingomonas sp. Root1294]KQY72260.1 hypothetical protein ASD39_20240 [Sphingomonas sp. Root50]KRB94469.1 hypothetical protein ASE22_00510 [Sphingomonas sp. Root720]
MSRSFPLKRASDITAFGSDVIEWTPADTDLPSGTRGFFLDADGTVTFKNKALVTRTAVPVKGVFCPPFVPRRITAIGTATKVYLIV